MKGKFAGKIAGLAVGGFWLAWTLGLSAVFVGYALSGELLFVQLGVIIVVFYISFRMWKNEKIYGVCEGCNSFRHNTHRAVCSIGLLPLTSLF